MQVSPTDKHQQDHSPTAAADSGAPDLADHSLSPAAPARPKTRGEPAVLRSPEFTALPAGHRDLVKAALATYSGGTIAPFIEHLVAMGGKDSVRALGCLMSEAMTDQGALYAHCLGGRHGTVYRLSKAMLRIAGAGRLSEEGDAMPDRPLDREARREVWDFVRYLAKGEHGDAETAMGARSVLFERFSNLPLVGGALEIALHAAQVIEGRGRSEAPSLLFKLYDLPWRLRSKLPRASQDSREDNLGEILRKQAAEARAAASK